MHSKREEKIDDERKRERNREKGGEIEHAETERGVEKNAL